MGTWICGDGGGGLNRQSNPAPPLNSVGRNLTKSSKARPPAEAEAESPPQVG